MQKRFFLSLFFILFLGSSLYGEPIINVNQPIKKLKLTSTDLEHAIISAATAQKWTIDSYGNGSVVATFKKSRYMAKIIF